MWPKGLLYTQIQTRQLFFFLSVSRYEKKKKENSDLAQPVLPFATCGQAHV